MRMSPEFATQIGRAYQAFGRPRSYISGVDYTGTTDPNEQSATVITAHVRGLKVNIEREGIGAAAEASVIRSQDGSFRVALNDFNDPAVSLMWSLQIPTALDGIKGTPPPHFAKRLLGERVSLLTYPLDLSEYTPAERIQIKLFEERAASKTVKLLESLGKNAATHNPEMMDALMEAKTELTDPKLRARRLFREPQSLARP